MSLISEKLRNLNYYMKKQWSMASDSSNITQHEPMYGNENRTPPIPVKGTKYS